MTRERQSVTDFYREHRERGGHDNDEVLIEKIAAEFPIDKPPEVIAVPYVPRDFAPVSDEVALYHKRRTRDVDFDTIRNRMLERLTGEERDLADSDYSEFNFQYQRLREEAEIGYLMKHTNVKL